MGYGRLICQAIAEMLVEKIGEGLHLGGSIELDVVEGLTFDLVWKIIAVDGEKGPKTRSSCNATGGGSC